jgi:hypothetical protein
MKESVNINEFLHKRTLIIGDVNTGKTILTRQILEEMCRQGLHTRIAIVDLAPDVPRELALEKGLKGVGGRLFPPEEKDVFYLWTSIKPPRLSSRSEEEAVVIAQRNAQEIEVLFHSFVRKRREILLVNDMTLYLQAGSAQRMIRWMEHADTIVANGYYGEKLGSGILSQRERHEMESLMEFFDHVMRLPLS